MASIVEPPAAHPCRTCPYRQDVPAGIWAREEYDKLRRYDATTPYQPSGVFLCHQTHPDSGRARVCGGWAGCHDGEELLALRLAVLDGRMSAEVARQVVDYTSPIPLFTTGAQAADHGMTGIDTPADDARHAIAKIVRRRDDIQPG